MVAITLPDGSICRFEGAVSGQDVARTIGRRLARDAVAMRLDGVLRDLTTIIDRDAAVTFVTRDSDDGLDILRHACAHVLAQATQELFPDAKIAFGPTTADGFYYDFHRETPFSPADFAAIEQRMREIIARDAPVRREVWTRRRAATWFSTVGETFKAEWVAELPEDAEITIYRQGDSWLDLCRGPHLPNTGGLGDAFKLMKLSGAYWRGDPMRSQLQRIYGTYWRNAKELDAYLTRLQEAERRDHRRLGREMALFHFQEEALGSVFWLPKGWTLYRTCESHLRRRLEAAGYEEVRTPQLLDRALWERSGHWEKFREHMFIAEVDEPDFSQRAEDHDGARNGRRMLALKPMNCPCHVQIFRQGIVSYRDLPLRMMEFGACHRYEPHGALHGLMRVRAFTQDDAHIFCAEDQIVSETQRFCDLLRTVYRDFGFEEVAVKFSDRPANRAGDDATWDRAEAALRDATEAAGLSWTLNPGEGAFYGPKLEFTLRDAIGRDWQCGTLQVDFVLPERLDASYVAADGARRRPVMLHRAILGSFERFIGILIEQYEGRFPLWLAPTQVTVATITDAADAYAATVAEACAAAGLRVETDLRNQKIGYKVREHSARKTPVLLVVGAREAESGAVAIRRLGGATQELRPLAETVAALTAEARPPQ